MQPSAQRRELDLWRGRLVEILAKDPKGHIGQRQSRLAESIAPDFPDMRIVHLYFSPSILSSSPRIIGRPFSASTNLIPRAVNVPALLKLAKEDLRWRNFDQLSSKGRSLLFPSILMRETVSILDYRTVGPLENLLPLTIPLIIILGFKSTSPITAIKSQHNSRPDSKVPHFKIEYDATQYLSVARRYGTHAPTHDISGSAALRESWIPVSVLERTHTDLVAAYRARPKSKAKKPSKKQDGHTPSSRVHSNKLVGDSTSVGLSTRTTRGTSILGKTSVNPFEVWFPCFLI